MIDLGATVVVAGKAFHATLFRLQELAFRKGKDLSRLHIVSIVTEDPYGEEEGIREVKVRRYLEAINQIKFTLNNKKG